MDPYTTNFPNGRWFKDSELLYAASEWQNSINQDWDIVWGSSTTTINGISTNSSTGTYNVMTAEDSTGTNTFTYTLSVGSATSVQFAPVLLSNVSQIQGTSLIISTNTLNVPPWVNPGNPAIGGQPDPFGGNNAWLLSDFAITQSTQTIPTSVGTLANFKYITYGGWFMTEGTGTGQVEVLNGPFTEAAATTFSTGGTWAFIQGTHTFTLNPSTSGGRAGSFNFTGVTTAAQANLYVYQPFVTGWSHNPIVGPFNPTPDRLEAFYWQGTTGTFTGGQRLSGRLLEDLEGSNKEWRAALPDSPREVVQYDSHSFFLWPTPSYSGVLYQEYPLQLSLSTSTQSIGLPFWCYWMAKYYVCSKAYARPGPTNDLKKAARYMQLYTRCKNLAKTCWDNYTPYRYRKLKPAGKYEWDILRPPSTTMGPGA